MLSASSARADQLGQVLEPALGLDGALLLELDEVARAVEQRLEQRRRLVGLGQLGDRVEQLEERGDPLHGGAAHAGVGGVAERVHEADAAAGRVGVELADGAVADAALGRVEDALHRHLVGGVDDGLQVGEGVLHLAPVVEPRAADDLVGHAHAGEVLLHHAALRVGPVEDRDVGPPQVATVVQLGHLARDPLRLVHLVVGVVPHDRVAIAAVGPQLLRLAAQVVGDDGVGRVEDRLRRPVVLLQHHDRDVRKGVLELEDVPHVRSAEACRCCSCTQISSATIVVRALDLEVVHRPVVGDGVDASRPAPGASPPSPSSTRTVIPSRRCDSGMKLQTRSPICARRLMISPPASAARRASSTAST